MLTYHNQIGKNLRKTLKYNQRKMADYLLGMSDALLRIGQQNACQSGELAYSKVLKEQNCQPTILRPEKYP